MQVLTYTSKEQWLHESKEYVHKILKAIHAPIVGLSGGSTPIPLYSALSESDLPWEKSTCILLDERYVDKHHEHSNQRMVRSTLCTNYTTDVTLLAPDTSLPLSECITEYANTLQNMGLNIDNSNRVIDLAILGMGPDGHIASLFPPLAPQCFGPDMVIHTTTDTFAIHDRISLTLPLLTQAHHRLLLIQGREKYQLLQTMQSSTIDTTHFPAMALFDERTTWMVLLD